MISFKQYENYKAGIYFSGENWEDIKNLCHKYEIQWNNTKRAYIGDKKYFYHFTEDLYKIEHFNNYEKYRNHFKPALETYKVRKKLDKTQFKKPIYKGKAPYENYQQEDIQRVINTNRLLLAHDCGLGKTYITITGLNHHIKWNNFDRLLVICPTEVLLNWKLELLKFSEHFQSDDIKIATKDERDVFDKDFKVVIMTYNTFKLSFDYYYEKTTKKKPNKLTRKNCTPFI